MLFVACRVMVMAMGGCYEFCVWALERLEEVSLVMYYSHLVV